MFKLGMEKGELDQIDQAVTVLPGLHLPREAPRKFIYLPAL